MRVELTPVNLLPLLFAALSELRLFFFLIFISSIITDIVSYLKVYGLFFISLALFYELVFLKFISVLRYSIANSLGN